MEPAKATCGCGREMRVDAMVGPLAFRCGCGARFNLHAPQLDTKRDRCVFVASMSRCRAVRLPDVPVCQEHAAMIAAAADGTIRQFNQRQADLLDSPAEPWSEVIKRNLPPPAPGYSDRVRADIHARKLPGSVVYYVRIRPGVIKIGVTINLDDRLKAMRMSAPGDLLAAEPGDRAVEKARHAKFADFRMDCRREDFAEADELLAYIRAVRSRYGDPRTLPARLLAQHGGETVISA